MGVQSTPAVAAAARQEKLVNAAAPILAASALKVLDHPDVEPGEFGSAWEDRPYAVRGRTLDPWRILFTDERGACSTPPPPTPPMGPARRVLDLTIAAISLVALAPVLVMISILIKLQDGGPVLFSQDRIGRGGRRFQCLKFRSMWSDAEARLESVLAADPELRREWSLDHKLRNDPRVTEIGAFLRRTSLDELPQLFNIFAGDMSVVGPRPIVEAEIARYGRWYRYYTSVTPGLTGLWQVNGRSGVSYRKRVAMDRLYVRMHSLGSYAYILWRTVPAVLARRGAH